MRLTRIDCSLISRLTDVICDGSKIDVKAQSALANVCVLLKIKSLRGIVKLLKSSSLCSNAVNDSKKVTRDKETWNTIIHFASMRGDEDEKGLQINLNFGTRSH